MLTIRIYKFIFGIDRQVKLRSGQQIQICFSYSQLILALSSIIAMIFISKKMLYSNYPAISYLVLPALTVSFFTIRLVNGKTPFKFLYSCILYILMPSSWSRYRSVNEPCDVYWSFKS